MFFTELIACLRVLPMLDLETSDTHPSAVRAVWYLDKRRAHSGRAERKIAKRERTF